MRSAASHDAKNSATGPIASGGTDRDHEPASGRSQPQIQRQHRGTKNSKQVCRFYGTKKGCRAGEQCPYRHVQVNSASANQFGTSQSSPTPQPGEDQTTDSNTSEQKDPELPPTVPDTAPRQSRQTSGRRAVVAKPVSSLQQKDPREFQIGQVVRRFSPSREDSEENTTLKLRLQPSDPDFPFELEALECSLVIPTAYPRNNKPTIQIGNKDIPRGFQINVERGFDTLVAGSAGKTLLQLLNELDRSLEKFLTAEKAQTIKIVANRRKDDNLATAASATTAPEIAPPEPPVPLVSKPLSPEWTMQQKLEAKAKREAETRQLEARMSRLPLFKASSDGISFNVPLQIPKPSRLPLSLQSLKEATLIVPVLYDLEPCRIKLKGVTGAEAENAEVAFERRARDHRESTLMGHINYLTQNLHHMVVGSIVAQTSNSDNVASDAGPVAGSPDTARQPEQEVDRIIDEDRPHLRFISHSPPEWSRHAAGDENSDSDTSEEDETSNDDFSDGSEGTESQAGGAAVQVPTRGTSLEKGVLLSFPQLELHGIELLEIHSLSLSVKCDRCKATLDINNIKPAEPTSTLIRTESCNKCASPLSVSFRAEPMHMNSIKAGYLDLEGCTVADLLLSRFLPTCSECSTLQPLPGINSVRGDSPLSVCHECHHRLNFKIPEVKFLRVASNDPRLNLPLRSKRQKENLGISAGSELPERGRCKHYAKSYRWFRFSCCNRVYACDRCHDEKEEHANEHGNRMICGWCSREQNYRPEDCGMCGRSVIRKSGGGFWEGGKGTRDKVKMSRKDPRKFKRIGGGTRGAD